MEHCHAARAGMVGNASATASAAVVIFEQATTLSWIGKGNRDSQAAWRVPRSGRALIGRLDSRLTSTHPRFRAFRGVAPKCSLTARDIQSVDQGGSQVRSMSTVWTPGSVLLRSKSPDMM